MATTARSDRPHAVSDYRQAQAKLAADYVERARSIAALVDSEADETERGSMITRKVHDAFVEQGLYWMGLPRELGGAELGARSVFEVIEVISRADTSTGWSLMANACNNVLVSGFVPEEGAQMIFGRAKSGIACGQFSPAGKAVEADGGLTGGGRFQFGSGCGHADWIGGGVIVCGSDGKPRLLEGGMPDTRVILMPRQQADLLGNWDVIGLLGTASFDYEIADQFVPDGLVMQGAHAREPLRGGPYHRFGWFGNGAVGHAAIVAGLTARALEEIVGIVHGKTRIGYAMPAHEHPVFQHEFATNEAAYQAARLLVLDAIDTAEADIVAGSQFTALHSARMRQSCSWMHKVAVDVVQFCHHWGASRSFRNGNVLARCSRDLAVATQHVIADETVFSANAGPIYQSWLDQLSR